ncbi:MAG: DUF4956 domain-containing protein [Caldilineaceae bacterium]|nr:DUF4956 domain-containing protein [Caldilineaceae bacterium]
MSELYQLLPGFILNLIISTIIIGFIYYPDNRSKHDYIFTFYSFNILIYFVSGLLRDVQLTIGFGFGLLAVFSTLRYRTEPVLVKDMTYLFICITLPFMNTLFMATRITFTELVIINSFVVVVIFVLEKRWGVNYEAAKEILYERIELVKPENYELLLTDLRQRTGLPVSRAEVVSIDFLRDTALLNIYYDAQAEEPERAAAYAMRRAGRE